MADQLSKEALDALYNQANQAAFGTGAAVNAAAADVVLHANAQNAAANDQLLLPPPKKRIAKTFVPWVWSMDTLNRPNTMAFNDDYFSMYQQNAAAFGPYDDISSAASMALSTTYHSSRSNLEPRIARHAIVGQRRSGRTTIAIQHMVETVAHGGYALYVDRERMSVENARMLMYRNAKAASIGTHLLNQMPFWTIGMQLSACAPMVALVVLDNLDHYTARDWLELNDKLFPYLRPSTTLLGILDAG